jgi:hypothetical protein
MAKTPEDPGYVPPISDHSWRARTRQLLRFLGHSRSWVELDEWAKTSSPSFLRHALAWLESQGEARSVFRNGTIYWISSKGLWTDARTSDPPNDRKGKQDHGHQAHLDPVIPKPPHLPSIPCLEPFDQPATGAPHDTIPCPPPLPSSPFLTSDTIPASHPIDEAEGEGDHHTPVSTIPSPHH